jgi:hypothetical protein
MRRSSNTALGAYLVAPSFSNGSGAERGGGRRAGARRGRQTWRRGRRRRPPPCPHPLVASWGGWRTATPMPGKQTQGRSKPPPLRRSQWQWACWSGLREDRARRLLEPDCTGMPIHTRPPARLCSANARPLTCSFEIASITKALIAGKSMLLPALNTHTASAPTSSFASMCRMRHHR